MVRRASPPERRLQAIPGDKVPPQTDPEEAGTAETRQRSGGILLEERNMDRRINQSIFHNLGLD